MFFILSKILIYLLVPFFWILILLTWFALSKNKRTKKRVLTAAIVLTILFTNPFIYHSLVSAWQPKPTVLPKNISYSTGILLGGLSGYDKDQHGYFGDNADRFIATANLYHQGIIKQIIVSGGTSKLSQDEPAESFFLKNELMKNGIKESAIILESKSRNTYENGVYSKAIIDSLHLQPPFILVTSALHMPRSISVFKRTGIPIIPFPCDYKVIPKKFDIDDYIIPDPKLLHDWMFFLKEIVGYYVYKLTGKA